MVFQTIADDIRDAALCTIIPKLIKEGAIINT